MAKKMQGELELEQEFEDANRRFHADQDSKIATKLQKESDFPNGVPKPKDGEGASATSTSTSFSELEGNLS
ncbi:hypothetical protein CYMTET_46120 [Cymbomonas tetramitiformis]|nr:hypothetical protein CYMTET_46120 [Cymbomonas tetramitiformis]